MTTATMGQRGATTSKAFVAVVSKNGMQGLATLAAQLGHAVHQYTNWGEVTESGNEPWDVILTDDESGAGLPEVPPAPVVLVTDGETGPVSDSRFLAVLPAGQSEAVLGAMLEVLIDLQVALRRCRELEGIVGSVQSGSALVGNSPIIRRLHGSLSRAADSDATVLIEGPSGAGKTLAARIVHCKSRRSSGAPLFCEADGIDADRFAQVLAEAGDTTLVLENIERMPATGQAAMVRHLKERSTGRGGRAPRLIATTAAHLPELVARGAFREDLYYRLHSFPILVPSLRERTEDIVPIAEAVLASAGMHGARGPQVLSDAAVN
ncbi:MAG: ATPase, partial [Planctomycetota bacterium]